MSSHALPPELDPRGRHRGRTSHMGVVKPLGRVLGALLSASLLLAAGYYWTTFRNIDNGVTRLKVSVNQAPDGKDDIDGKDQNILLVGNDDRENMTDSEVHELHVGRDGGSLATDTMMIVHVPADGSRATLISLPRDTFVDIPDGYRPNKLNSAYASAYVDAKGDLNAKRAAGADLLIKTITRLTGLTINHYVQVDLLGFYRISKAIGGVSVNLCHAVDDRVKTNRASGEGGGSGLHLSAGKHSLSGLEALEFVRQRHHLTGGDLDRVKRQQYFLTAAFRKVASAGILFKLNALGDAIKQSVYLDPTLKLLDLARQMDNLTANNIVGKTIPTHSGSDGLMADPQKVQRFIDKLIGKVDSGSTPSPKSGGTSKSKSSSPTATKSPGALDAKCIN